jgi:two-component sensor histidine kinase
MATLGEIASLRTSLSDGAVAHLHRLVAAWSLLADLSFSDMFLVAPDGRHDFVVLAQVRPNNRATMIVDDLVGTTQTNSHWPLIQQSFSSRAVEKGVAKIEGVDELLPNWVIPVGYDGQMIAAIVRVQGPLRGPASAYESVYLDIFDRFCVMVGDATFPYREADVAGPGFPRVGDGIILIDEKGLVEFATPNATNALHRLGLYVTTEGRSLKELGLHVRELERAREYGMPRREDVARGDVAIDFLCAPILAGGEVTGLMVILRDVSELKRLDRQITSKDAAIREVHHRVKNNLQTVSSLLKLQARRSEDPGARTALLEAERRIRSIAVVHEVLSREPGDVVGFGEIVPSLVTMVEESEFGTHQLEIYVDGDLGSLPTDIATPLAIVVAEIMMNAAEHAFTSFSPDDVAIITLTLRSLQGHYVAEIRDNGRGLDPNFSFEVSTSLGLSIVRDLVRNQLRGTITMSTVPPENGTGTTVVVRVPQTT